MLFDMGKVLFFLITISIFMNMIRHHREIERRMRERETLEQLRERKPVFEKKERKRGENY